MTGESEDAEIEDIIERRVREMMHILSNREYSGSGKVRLIYEASDSDFDKSVIKRSWEVPIIVDFWAPWCGPCYILSPVIESIVKSLRGKILLAKLNIDENPYTASKYGIMNIPTVVLLKDGKVIDYFVGALPEEMVMEWLRKNMILS